MRIALLSIGRGLPDWIGEGFATYAKRMPRECALELIELSPDARTRKKDVASRMKAEAELLESRIPSGALRVVLDERGRTLDSPALAVKLERWLESGRDVAMLIGGADGLAPELKRAAEFTWSLSPLTLPHGLVRVVVAEQLYRALSILRGHPYHRE